MVAFFRDINFGSIDTEKLIEQKEILINWVMEKGEATDNIDVEQAEKLEGLIYKEGLKIYGEEVENEDY